MHIPAAVREVLGWYDGERPGVKASLARLLMHGRTAGTGRLLILPVDQGVEHGPDASFAPNPDAYDPRYHFDLAIDGGVSGLAGPLGFLTIGADRYAGAVPLILKVNGANTLSPLKNSAVTGTVRDALELGCCAIGFSIYPGSDFQYEMFEEVRDAVAEAKAHGLAVIIWAYPRGGGLSSEDETSLDVIAYAAQIAVQLGAHIVKVKPPAARLAATGSATGPELADLSARIAHVRAAAFAGRRLVVFSGGPAKDLAAVTAEVSAIAAGGGRGAMVGRNTFQRPRREALQMLERIAEILIASGADARG